MEIKNGKKVVITGRDICFVVGIVTLAVGIYWLVRALLFDDTNLPAMLSSISCALFLLLYVCKRR